MITRLVTHPKSFVERQSKYPGIRTQSIITALVGLAFAAKHVGTYFLLGDAWGNVNQAVMVYATIELLVPFLIWGVVSIMMYYTARYFDGYFSIGLIFRLAGWGMAPLIASGLVQSASRLYALSDRAPPAEPGFSAIQYYLEAYETYVGPTLSEPVFLLGTAVAILFVPFSGYIWGLTVAHIGDIGLGDGLRVSVVPCLIALLWLLSPWLL